MSVSGRRDKDMAEPELHVLGEIVGASGVESENACVGFELVKGKEWLCVGGDQKGQTQVDYPETGEMHVWNHPIDVHYYTKSMQGWPRLCCEVWRQDFYGAQSICGYAFCYIPTQPGQHKLDVPIWRPCGNHRDELHNFFLGLLPVRLRDLRVVYDPLTAKEERCKLFTKNAGTIHLELTVVLRNTKPHDIK